MIMTIHCLRVNFCHNAVTAIATMVATKVAISMGINISVGYFEFNVALCAMMLTGIIVSPDALSTMNMICELEAVSFIGFSSCRLFMAFKLNGVAALSRPSILAEKLIIICPMAGWLRGSSGNSLLNKGAVILDRKF